MTTQFAKASYQEIIDLHTEEDTVSVIGIHTPQGDTPRKMFGGFFDQFKKFKYLGCSVSLVPAARLPADPSQVSYEAGEQYIDPRDMLNPLMFHGCHGNDMGVILNRFYNANSIADSPQTDSTFYYADSITDITEGDHISGLQLEDLYYKALTDNTWRKAHPQRGFKKSGLRPLVYSMATNMQFSAGDSIGMDGYGIPEDLVEDVSASGQNITATFPVSQNGRRFFTPRLTGLGWLDTRNVLTTAATVTGSTADIRAMLGDVALAQQNASEADLPLVYMGMILLPPAYKTEQYFRMIVNHHFAFKDFRGISFSNNLVEPPSYNQLNDPNDRYYPDDGGSVDPPTPDPPIGSVHNFTLSGVSIDLSTIGSTSAISDLTLDAFPTLTYLEEYPVNVSQSFSFARSTEQDPQTEIFFALQNVAGIDMDSIRFVVPRIATGSQVYSWSQIGVYWERTVTGVTYCNIFLDGKGYQKIKSQTAAAFERGGYYYNILQGNVTFDIEDSQTQTYSDLGTTVYFEDVAVEVSA